MDPHLSHVWSFRVQKPSNIIQLLFFQYGSIMLKPSQIGLPKKWWVNMDAGLRFTGHFLQGLLRWRAAEGLERFQPKKAVKIGIQEDDSTTQHGDHIKHICM